MNHIIFAGDTTTPQRAREFVDLRLNELGLAHLVEVVRLLTSELVTNAVLGGAGQIRLAVQGIGSAVRVEVDSSQPDRSVRHHFPGDPELERGMSIVETVATSWGVDRHDDTKTAWFEVSTSRPAH